MYKFKVKDKVTVIGNEGRRTIGSHCFSNGTIVEITELYRGDGGNFYRVKEGKYGDYWNVMEYDLQLLTREVKLKLDIWKLLKDNLDLPEKDILEILELVKLKQAIKELKTSELSCVED